VQVASLYVDQKPAGDLSHEVANTRGVQLCTTIAEALTLGTSRLAVDGIWLIAVTGDYPLNAKEQRLFPVRRFFDEAAVVLRAQGARVPVFNDKGLGATWEDALHIYRTARELGLPFMAGASRPVTVRRPPLELPWDTPLNEALLLYFGPVESFGFHALEALQCMVERRQGRESGIQAVHCLEGPAVWQSDWWSERLFDAASEVLPTVPSGSAEQVCKDPVAFHLEYRDGLRATVLLLNGFADQCAFAAQVRDRREVVATCMVADSGPPYVHFSGLVYYVENLFITGKEQYPIERTLLTTGTLDALMDSRYRGHKRVETAHLGVTYDARQWPR